MPTYEDRKQPQLSLEDLLHLRWLLGGCMALVSIWTLFHLEAAVWPIAVLASLAILVAMVVPGLSGRVSRTAWHLGVPLIAVFFAVDLYLGDMIPAFVRLTVLLVLYRAVSHRSRREDLQLVVLCLFLIIVTGVLTVSMAFALQIVVFTALAMMFLFVVNLIRDLQGDDSMPPSQWALISRKRMLVRLRRTVDLRLAVLGVLLVCMVVCISGVIFLAIPRFQMEGAINLLQFKRAKSMTGFSETIALGEVTEITQDNSIAMRVDVQGAPTRPTVPYWRMVVLDEYGHGVFRVSRAVQAKVGARSNLVMDLWPEGSTSRRAAELPGTGEQPRYVVFMEAGISRYLPLPGVFDRVRFKESQEIVPNPVFRVFATQRHNAVMLSYQIEGGDFGGVIPDPQFPTLNLRAPVGPAGIESIDESLRSRFLNYPATTTTVPVEADAREYLASVVAEITAGEDLDAATFAQRACEYLARTHHYSLGVTLPPGGDADDPVVRWMKAGLPGHCEFFTASFTLLSRMAGHPTRAITGFKGGSWNAYENYYMVRNSDAHAWCEVYDGNGNWFRVDPTTGAGALGGPIALEAALGAMAPDRSVSAYFDSLRMLWYRRIVSFDERSQKQVVISMRAAGLDFVSWAGAGVSDGFGEFLSWTRRPWTVESRGDLITVVTVLLLAAYLIRRSGARVADMLGWMKTGEGPTRRRAGSLLRRLQIRLSEPAVRRRWDPVRARELESDLRAIRFGSPERWPDPARVFRSVRRLL